MPNIPQNFEIQTPLHLQNLFNNSPEIYLVLRECLADQQLMTVFHKLFKIPLPKKLTAIEKMIDQATGYVPYPDHDEFFLLFTSFIYETVFCRLTLDVRQDLKEQYKQWLSKQYDD